MRRRHQDDPATMLKEFVKGIPVVRDVARKAYNALTKNAPARRPFPGSRTYWQDRYDRGGNSGVGSYGKFAEFKADVLNSFVIDNNIQTVIEFGCGDGNQLMLANYPEYIGFDVSPTAIARCRAQFASERSKSFRSLESYAGERAQLALSLDVIYHLIEDDAFEEHMRGLFAAATRFVIIYSSDTDANEGNENTHVKHRKFTSWVEANCLGWSREGHIPNRYPYHGDYRQGSLAEFFIYKRRT